MSVRRRTWTNRDRSPGEAWVVDYVDQHGKRHLKTFDRRRDAKAYHAAVDIDVRKGTHTADRGNLMVFGRTNRRAFIAGIGSAAAWP